MEALADLNTHLLSKFPRGIKIILSELPLQDYSLLISFALTFIGIILLILVIRWNPPRPIPEGLKPKYN